MTGITALVDVPALCILGVAMSLAPAETRREGWFLLPSVRPDAAMPGLTYLPTCLLYIELRPEKAQPDTSGNSGVDRGPKRELERRPKEHICPHSRRQSDFSILDIQLSKKLGKIFNYLEYLYLLDVFFLTSGKIELIKSPSL